MTPEELQRYLHAYVPLSEAMGARVVTVDGAGARLEAPLAPNRNVHGTVFGGSSAALGILAGWAFVHAGLRREGARAGLLIARHEIDYTAPASGAIAAVAEAPSDEAWDRFLTTFRRRGRARLDVRVALSSGGRPVATCSARYVAVRDERDAADAS